MRTTLVAQQRFFLISDANMASDAAAAGEPKCEDLESKLKAVLPHLTEGPIVKGFGRGSSDLG